MAAPTLPESQASGPRSESGALYLVVMGPNLTVSHELTPGASLLVGRAEDSDVRLIDPEASRNHLRLHVGGDREVEIEDLGSANGTRLRDERIRPGRRLAIEPGDVVSIGATVLFLQRREPAHKPRALWPHGYFESRVIEECARAEAARGTFAIVRVHVDEGDPAGLEQLLPRVLRAGDLAASYGPRDAEVLLVDTGRAQAESLRAQLDRALTTQGLRARTALTFYPGDGTSPQALLSHASSALLAGAETGATGPALVLESAAMRQLYAVAERAAASNINVLVLGETGVGKEVLAQAIHRRSSRAAGPFVCVNCAALTESLLDSELFGHERGAFTGAVQTKPGLLEAASGGTLFFDEVGEMSLGLQAKLLRALETRQILRVGGTRPRDVDVRIIAATNRDLEEEVAARTFRQDLYFRLNGISLEIPPLRERPEDVPPLARAFLAYAARQSGRSVPILSDEALRMLQGYAWPGNVRELRNVVERALVLSSDGLIAPVHLPLDKMQAAGDRTPLRERREKLERQAILDALARCAGNQTRAAELLGMPRRTFCEKLKEYRIPRPRHAQG